MSRTNLNETSIPVGVTTLAASAGMRFDAPDVERLYTTLMSSISTFLFDKKDKNVKTCVKVQDTEGNFYLAGIVEYHAPTDEDVPGNWSYVLTNKEEDLADCQNDYDIADLAFNTVALTSAHVFGKMDFENYAYLHSLFIICVKALIEWLDANAKEGEIVEVECPKSLLASVAIEGKEKVFAFTPSAEMKAMIKDDIAIEK